MINEYEQLRRRCEALEDRLDRLEPWVTRIDLAAISDRERVEAIEHQLHDLLATNGGVSAGRPGWKYNSVYDWVDDWFVIAFARADNPNVAWCPRWHDHPEALIRLSLLWRAWETHLPDAGRGMATWYRDFGDAQFERLTDPLGTFRFCTRQAHRKVPPMLPVEVHHD